MAKKRVLVTEKEVKELRALDKKRTLSFNEWLMVNYKTNVQHFEEYCKRLAKDDGRENEEFAWVDYGDNLHDCYHEYTEGNYPIY